MIGSNKLSYWALKTVAHIRRLTAPHLCKSLQLAELREQHLTTLESMLSFLVCFSFFHTRDLTRDQNNQPSAGGPYLNLGSLECSISTVAQ